ncbi:MAG TPA: hypothetical protein VMA34_16935 [Terracidiphilus sp.]|nr:hypothetical protein [Terracidiphilus sp.]
MSSNERCWCGKPVQKSELESSVIESVFRCEAGHRLARQTALKQIASVAPLATLGVILGGIDLSWIDGGS